jgi:2-oxoglutarate dehydrogenase E2 component (dihydrolipoamide succinyltransferase)
MGDSITEGTIVDLPVAPGDFMNADDVVVVLETDKVSVDVRAQEIMEEIDDVVEVGSGLYKIDTDGKPSGDTAATHAASADALVPVAVGAPPSQAPAAPSAVPPPTAAAPPPHPKQAAPPKAAAAPAASAPPLPSTPVLLGGRIERRTKMSRMCQRVAVRLKEAQNTAAMLTTFQEYDMGNLMEMRKVCKDVFEKKHGIMSACLCQGSQHGCPSRDTSRQCLH